MAAGDTERLIAKKREYRRRYYLAHREECLAKAKEYRRAHGIFSRVPIDKEKVAKMYLDGVPVGDIAKAFRVTIGTIYNYMRLAGVRRERSDLTAACRNCWLYPCFRGIDTMASNLAKTCKSYKFKYRGNGQRESGDTRRSGGVSCDTLLGNQPA